MPTPSNRPLDFWHWLPWTRLFRAFRIACDPRKLTLAAIALVLLWAVDRCLYLLPIAPVASPQQVSPQQVSPQQVPTANRAALVRESVPLSLITPPTTPWNAVSPSLLLSWEAGGRTIWNRSPAQTGRALLARLLLPLEPIWSVARWPLRPRATWSDVAWVWTRLMATLILWSIFGGAIVRIAAVEFARDERLGILAALRFSLSRFLSLFAAPLLPLAGVLVLWGICALGGVVGLIPGAGPFLVALAWGVALVLALVIALVLIAVAAGWPLMNAAIMTEGSDAFDGFSRSFSYLYGRPWYYSWCVFFALLWGLATVMMVDTLAVGVVRLAARVVATGASSQRVAELHAAMPRYFDAAAPLGTPAVPSSDYVWPAGIVSVWLAGTALLAVGFAVSYFWSAATIVYFLLRRAEDATHFDEVFVDASETEDDLLPLAGIAATGQPVTVRPYEPQRSQAADPVHES